MKYVQLDDKLARAMLPPRDPRGAKWDFGRALLICGAREMPGAAVLAAKAALRAGVGLIRIASIADVCASAQAQICEATYCILPESASGGISEVAAGALARECARHSGVLFGPGMGNTGDTLALLTAVLQSGDAPVVIDADGLNALSVRPGLLREARGQVILTPHIHEMSRLTGLPAEEIARDPATHAAEYARNYGVVVVLKGAASYIASPKGDIFFLDMPNSGLAKGGSGDTLAGLIVSLAAQGVQSMHAAALGVYLHAHAGALARDAFGERCMQLGDIAQFLPDVFARLEERGRSTVRIARPVRVGRHRTRVVLRRVGR